MSNVIEQWRPVVGWEGFYEVSDQGSVRSLPHTERYLSSLGRPVTRFSPGRDLKCGLNPQGYPKVSLSAEGRVKQKRVHSLVLEAFVGPCPEGMEGCHNNGDATDARLVNLRWDTHLENNRDRSRHGTIPGVYKTECPRGHAYDHANTYIRPSGARMCRACNRARTAAAHKQKMLALRAA